MKKIVSNKSCGQISLDKQKEVQDTGDERMTTHDVRSTMAPSMTFILFQEMHTMTSSLTTDLGGWSCQPANVKSALFPIPTLLSLPRLFLWSLPPNSVTLNMKARSHARYMSILPHEHPRQNFIASGSKLTIIKTGVTAIEPVDINASFSSGISWEASQPEKHLNGSAPTHVFLEACGSWRLPQIKLTAPRLLHHHHSVYSLYSFSGIY